jgi:hypothetical protein
MPKQAERKELVRVKQIRNSSPKDEKDANDFGIWDRLTQEPEKVEEGALEIEIPRFCSDAPATLSSLLPDGWFQTSPKTCRSFPLLAMAVLGLLHSTTKRKTITEKQKKCFKSDQLFEHENIRKKTQVKNHIRFRSLTLDIYKNKTKNSSSKVNIENLK